MSADSAPAGAAARAARTDRSAASCRSPAPRPSCCSTAAWRATDKRPRGPAERPEMGTLFAIETTNTVVLAIVSALSVPVPAQREGESELWIAELGLVGELWKPADGRGVTFNRGVSVYPALGDRVRVASREELEQAFCGDRRNSVRVGCIRQDPSISAIVRVDDLLGKHFAILGTTGTGKSCTTALILRAILQKNPAAHMVLLDPAQRVRARLRRMGRGHQPAQHAAALLAAHLRGADRGADRQSAGAQGRGRDPAGPDPDGQGALRRRPRQRARGGPAPGRATSSTPSTRRSPIASRT